MKKDKNNLRSIPGLGQNNEFKDAIEQIKNNLKTHIDFITIDAQLRRVKYNQLVKEGFTPEQAIELCKGSFFV